MLTARGPGGAISTVEWRFPSIGRGGILRDLNLMHPIKIEYRELFGRRPAEAVFHVPLRDGQTVFMRTRYSTEQPVVVVDPALFVDAWRADRNGLHVQIADGNPCSWAADTKFPQTAAHFAQGIENPVPLADVGFRFATRPAEPSWFSRLLGSAHNQQQIPQIGFGDGVTRTIWLLAAGAKYFPLHCTERGALDLARCCGTAGADSIIDLHDGT